VCCQKILAGNFGRIARNSSKITHQSVIDKALVVNYFRESTNNTMPHCQHKVNLALRLLHLQFKSLLCVHRLVKLMAVHLKTYEKNFLANKPNPLTTAAISNTPAALGLISEMVCANKLPSAEATGGLQLELRVKARPS
jgi:hypothetical protein